MREYGKKLMLVILLLVVGRTSQSGERLLSVLVDGKYGFIDEKGRMVVEAAFDRTWAPYVFDEEPLPVRKKGKWGYVSAGGKIVVGFKYDFAYPFSDGRGLVEVGGASMFIDREGRVVIGPVRMGKHELRSGFSEGMAPWKKGNKWGYIDISGKWVIGARFDAAEGFRKGRAVVRVGDKWGIIGSDGEWIVEPRYEEIWMGYDGMAVGKKGGKYVVIGRDGGEKGPLPVECGGEFLVGDGMVGVKSKDVGLWGYCNEEGNVMIGYRYENAWPFFGGVAGVRDVVTGKWGVIDKGGKYVVRPRFDMLFSFQEGFAMFYEGMRMGYIDGRGRIVWSTDLLGKWRKEAGVMSTKELQQLVEEFVEGKRGVWDYGGIFRCLGDRIGRMFVERLEREWRDAPLRMGRLIKGIFLSGGVEARKRAIALLGERDWDLKRELLWLFVKGEVTGSEKSRLKEYVYRLAVEGDSMRVRKVCVGMGVSFWGREFVGYLLGILEKEEKPLWRDNAEWGIVWLAGKEVFPRCCYSERKGRKRVVEKWKRWFEEHWLEVTRRGRLLQKGW